MDPIAKDLFLKLLHKHPTKRLGAGKIGSENDCSALKRHEFFKTVDWEHIFEIDPPQREIFSPNLKKPKISDDMTEFNFTMKKGDETQETAVK